MSVIHAIAEKKRQRLIYTKRKVSLSDLKSRILNNEKPRSFRASVKRGSGRIRFIAEIKKASPSRGLVRKDFDPVRVASIYEQRAVDAVSVITEEDFFLGDLTYVEAVKQVITRPVLRKDFIVDEYQIYESRAYGADAILLIGALLQKAQAREYLALCGELGLSVLFEVHDPVELETALFVGADIIGINNRDLKSLAVNAETTFLLKKDIPSDKITVSESGIKSREDVLRLENAGIDAMLIGTSLMESYNIGTKIDELRGTLSA